MEQFVNRIKKQAASDLRTIVLAEGQDERVLAAAKQIAYEGFAKLIVLNPKNAIDSQNVAAIDTASSPLKDTFAQKLHELRKDKGVTLSDAKSLIDNPLYFGTMLVKCGYADGMVAGAHCATADLLRPALQIIKCAPNKKFVSTFFVMVLDDTSFGENGMFVFADCGLEVNPDEEKLAQIAIFAAESFEAMIKATPKVAMLSHSTYGSAKNEYAQKVQSALKLAKDQRPDLLIDGELQVDAAIVKEVAALKAPGSKVAGCANVLVFPNLDSGNIAYKLVQRLAGAKAYGPITQGLAAPINDLSRGCGVEDIVGVVAITCVQAQQIK